MTISSFDVPASAFASFIFARSADDTVTVNSFVTVFYSISFAEIRS